MYEDDLLIRNNNLSKVPLITDSFPHNSYSKQSATPEAEQIYFDLNQTILDTFAGLETDEEMIGLLYHRSNTIRFVTSVWGHLLQIAPWDVRGTDSEAITLVRDRIEQIQLMRSLGESYIWASVYGYSFLVLPPDFEEEPRIEGILHPGNRYCNDLHLTKYHRLIQQKSSDSLVRFASAYLPYLQALEVACHQAESVEVFVAKSGAWAKDIKAQGNEQKGQQLQNQIVAGIRNALHNEGVLILPEDAEYGYLTRNLEGITKVITVLKEHVSKESGISSATLWGEASTGTGLAAIDLQAKSHWSRGVQFRRTQHLTLITNWFINRILLSEGYAPETVLIKWSEPTQPDSKEEADIALVKAKTFEILIKNGVLTPQQVLESQFAGITSSEIAIEDDTDWLEYDNTKELIKELQLYLNMTPSQYKKWLRDSRSQLLYLPQSYKDKTHNLLSIVRKSRTLQTDEALLRHGQNLIKNIKRKLAIKPYRILPEHNVTKQAIGLLNVGCNLYKHRNSDIPSPYSSQPNNHKYFVRYWLMPESSEKRIRGILQTFQAEFPDLAPTDERILREYKKGKEEGVVRYLKDEISNIRKAQIQTKERMLELEAIESQQSKGESWKEFLQFLEHPDNFS